MKNYEPFFKDSDFIVYEKKWHEDQLDKHQRKLEDSFVNTAFGLTPSENIQSWFVKVQEWCQKCVVNDALDVAPYDALQNYKVPSSEGPNSILIPLVRKEGVQDVFFTRDAITEIVRIIGHAIIRDYKNGNYAIQMFL